MFAFILAVIILVAVLIERNSRYDRQGRLILRPNRYYRRMWRTR
jgi:hypothetical protein